MNGIMSILTVVVLVFVGWPVAFFASSLYIVCSPFGKSSLKEKEIGFYAVLNLAVCIGGDACGTVMTFLQKLIHWPHK